MSREVGGLFDRLGCMTRRVCWAIFSRRCFSTEETNMSEDDESTFGSYDDKETEEYEMHQKGLEAFDALSDEEQCQSMVRVGIITEDGELTERYGGDAPNPDNTD